MGTSYYFLAVAGLSSWGGVFRSALRLGLDHKCDNEVGAPGRDLPAPGRRALDGFDAGAEIDIRPQLLLDQRRVYSQKVLSPLRDPALESRELCGGDGCDLLAGVSRSHIGGKQPASARSHGLG
jgi:hypothetical protein